MPMPAGIGIIDLMLSLAPGDAAAPEPGSDPEKRVLEQMDRFGIERALIPVSPDAAASLRALARHPDRFFGTCELDPNRGMQEVRRLKQLVETHDVRAASAFPCRLVPQVPIDHKRFFPVYAACVELGIPICVSSGVPDLRVPYGPQKVERIDDVCFHFPELRFVMRDGGEPWSELAVKLLLKWPNLHYATSNLAPRDYPQAIVRYANTRGADKILFAGGPSLERSFQELPDVPFRDHVWPKFLRDNALRLFFGASPAR